MIDDIYRSYQYEVDKFSGRKKKESANIGAVEIGKDVNDNVDTAIKLNDDEFDNSTEVSRLSVNIDTIKKIFDSDLNLKIVWVTMDEHTIYRDHISGSHINIPFVIVSENKDSVSGFYTTSNLNNIRFRNNMVSKYKVVFKYGKYNIDKSPLILHDTLVNLPKKNVGRNILNLDSRDVSQLIKKACLYRNINLISSGNDELIQVGDIIENNGDEYFVYQKDNSMVYGIKFKRYEKEDKNIS